MNGGSWLGVVEVEKRPVVCALVVELLDGGGLLAPRTHLF